MAEVTLVKLSFSYSDPRTVTVLGFLAEVELRRVWYAAGLRVHGGETIHVLQLREKHEERGRLLASLSIASSESSAEEEAGERRELCPLKITWRLRIAFGEAKLLNLDLELQSQVCQSNSSSPVRESRRRHL